MNQINDRAAAYSSLLSCSRSGGSDRSCCLSNYDADSKHTKRSSARYEAQKQRDWMTFRQFLKNQEPPLDLGSCSSSHVLQFLGYFDQFGKTKVHAAACPFFGRGISVSADETHPCHCPLRQAWGSLDALVGRLRAAFEEHGRRAGAGDGAADSNPFGAWDVRLYLREVRQLQSKARGISYERKRRKRTIKTPLRSDSRAISVDQQQQLASTSNTCMLQNVSKAMNTGSYEQRNASHKTTKEENIQTLFYIPPTGFASKNDTTARVRACF